MNWLFVFSTSRVFPLGGMIDVRCVRVGDRARCRQVRLRLKRRLHDWDVRDVGMWNRSILALRVRQWRRLLGRVRLCRGRRTFRQRRRWAVASDLRCCATLT